MSGTSAHHRYPVQGRVVLIDSVFFKSISNWPSEGVKVPVAFSSGALKQRGGGGGGVTSDSLLLLCLSANVEKKKRRGGEKEL